MTFIAELRRRNVLRVAAAYALVAWIIIEAGSVLLPTFGAPQGAFQVYVIVVICGFVASVVLSWVFEWTPEGVRLERDIDRSVPPLPAARQRMNYAIIGLLAVALSVSISFNLSGIRSATAPAESDAARRSIAVLPFRDRSNIPDNILLTDGIHDDVLTRLANNRSLKVISRTSVLEYRDTGKKPSDIGRELGVETILEGTVQRSGDSVRINISLVDAASGESLWGKIYDRKLDLQDIFQVQTDIASAIAGELHAALSPADEGRLARVPTNNLVAYNRYAEARRNMATRGYTDAVAARRQFAEAVEFDPDFAEAYAGLATSTLLLYTNFNAIERDTAYVEAEASIERALALDPNLAEAYAALGLLKRMRWEETHVGPGNREAAAAFDKALSLNPNLASAYMWYAGLKESENRLDEAIALYQASLDVDPLGRIPYVNLPALYSAQGKLEETTRQLLRAIEIHPDWTIPYQYLAIHLNALGRSDEALAWLASARSLDDDVGFSGNMAVGIYTEFGDFDKARELLLDTPDAHPLADMIDGMLELFDNDPGAALAQFETAMDAKPSRPPFVYDIVANVALLAGEFETARKYVLLHKPVLAEDAEIVIDKFTARSVVQLAYLNQKQGKAREAYDLLTRTLPVVEQMPRLGMNGHGILDVQILTLLGRVEDAISAFSDAYAEGYRSGIVFNFWPLDYDPYLATLRDNERFIGIRDLIAADMQRMRENAIRAEETGNWDSLRQIAMDEYGAGMRAGLGSRPQR